IARVLHEHPRVVVVVNAADVVEVPAGAADRGVEGVLLPRPPVGAVGDAGFMLEATVLEPALGVDHPETLVGCGWVRVDRNARGVDATVGPRIAIRGRYALLVSETDVGLTTVTVLYASGRFRECYPVRAFRVEDSRRPRVLLSVDGTHVFV